MSQMVLRLDGTSCRQCVLAVHEALQSLEGVQVTLVQPCSALLELSTGSHSVDAILEAIQDEGFALSAHGVGETQAV